MRKFFVSIIFFVCLSFQLIADPIFTWDDAENFTKIHCYLEGKLSDGTQWYMRDVREADIPAYQELFANDETMKFFGRGAISYEKTEGYVRNKWIPDFQKGVPTGAMSIFLKDTHQFVGFCCVTPDGPGVANIGYAAHKDFWGKGVASSISMVLMQNWMKEVFEIGHGLKEHISPQLVEKFKCFDGESLNKIVATANPANIASWKLILKGGFKPSPTAAEPISINLKDMVFDNLEHMNTYLISHHFSDDSAPKLERDVLYRMIDPEGKEKTISFVSKYDALRYHFVLDLTQKD